MVVWRVSFRVHRRHHTVPSRDLPAALAAPDLEGCAGGGIRRVGARQRRTAGDAFAQKGLYHFLLDGIACDFIGQVLRNYRDTFVITDDDVAAINGDAAAANRHVAVDRIGANA